MEHHSQNASQNRENQVDPQLLQHLSLPTIRVLNQSQTQSHTRVDSAPTHSRSQVDCHHQSHSDHHPVQRKEIRDLSVGVGDIEDHGDESEGAEDLVQAGARGGGGLGNGRVANVVVHPQDHCSSKRGPGDLGEDVGDAVTHCGEVALLGSEDEGDGESGVEHGEGNSSQHDNQVPESEHGDEPSHVERLASTVDGPLSGAGNVHGEEHGAYDLVEDGGAVDGGVGSNVHGPVSI